MRIGANKTVWSSTFSTAVKRVVFFPFTMISNSTEWEISKSAAVIASSNSIFVILNPFCVFDDPVASASDNSEEGDVYQ